MLDENRLREMVNRIVERFFPDRIILFGSHARGTANRHSDVDILVISQFKGKRRDVLASMYKTLYGTGLAEEIVLMTPEEYEADKMIPGTIARPISVRVKYYMNVPKHKYLKEVLIKKFALRSLRSLREIIN